MQLTERLPPRPRSRGVAALELALSLTFLIPLLMGMLDFGYYFYIGTNAEEAARAGVREAVARGGTCGTTGAVTKALGEVPATGPSGSGCNGGAAYCAMNDPPLSMGGPSGNTTVTLTCLTPATPAPNTAPVDPTWRITVQVDFWPATTFCKFMMPPTTPASGKVRYTATVTSN
jgi:Flp pilus assembly protein TadG